MTDGRGTWYERRELLINACLTEPGFGAPRLVSDRHIGRVLMRRPFEGLPKADFFPQTSAECARLDHYYAAKQRKAFRALPK